MNADELGEKGESRFRELCADAGLICNKSDRDRAGWDFIVDFPFLFGGKTTLDQRKPALSCHVQVKTVEPSTTRVKLRLSSAERLAKEPKPSFICVLRVSPDNTFTGLSIIHVLDNVLATILARLRTEAKTKNDRINEKFVSLSIKRFGKEIPVGGIELRTALSNDIGSDLAKYISMKTDQLEKLGVPRKGFTVNMKATSLDDLVNTFLGLEQSVDFQITEEWEDRFGIRIAEPASGATYKALIQPQPATKCLLEFRHTELSKPLTFPADLYFPPLPNLPKKHMKALIKAHSFSMQITMGAIQLQCNPALVPPQQPQGWSDLWRLLELIQLGGELKVNAASHPKLRFQLPAMQLSASPETCNEEATLWEELSELLSIGGANPMPSLGASAADAVGQHITFLGALHAGRHVSPVTFTGQKEAFALLGGSEAAWFDFIPLGTGALAFAVVALLEDAGDVLRSSRVELKALRYLSDPVEEFSGFTADVQQMVSTRHVIGRRPTTGSASEYFVT